MVAGYKFVVEVICERCERGGRFKRRHHDANCWRMIILGVAVDEMVCGGM